MQTALKYFQLNCFTNFFLYFPDCQCYMFPYTPQPYPKNSTTGIRLRQLALNGTTNVLRANGVRLKNDCEYLNIENDTEMYCKAVKYIINFESDSDKLLEYHINCLDMWSKLQEKLGNIMVRLPKSIFGGFFSFLWEM